MNNKTLPSADIKSKNVKEPLLPKESKGELRMSQSMKNPKSSVDLEKGGNEANPKKDGGIIVSFKKAFTNKHLKEKFKNKTPQEKEAMRKDPESLNTKVDVRDIVNKISGLQFN